MLGVFAATLVLGWWAWACAPRPAAQGAGMHGVYHPAQHASLWRPWGRPAFRRLLAVFMLNGIASAIPATLVLFFAQDRLQAPSTQEPLFLGAYFVCAALSIPLWLRAVGRLGLARTWLRGMLLAVAVFAWTALLAAGRCAGLCRGLRALGHGPGHRPWPCPGLCWPGCECLRRRPGPQRRCLPWLVEFGHQAELGPGRWGCAAAVGTGGYSPGTHDAQGLQPWPGPMPVLPCPLKLLAAALLYRWWCVRPFHAVA